MKEFFDIDRIQKLANRTYIKRLKQVPGQTGKIFSEGCWSMVIINYSKVLELALTINKETIVLQPGAHDLTSLIDPAYPETWNYDKIELPGHVGVVRSDEIEFKWSKNDSPNQDMAIIRHSVVPFKEPNLYPPQEPEL